MNPLRIWNIEAGRAVSGSVLAGLFLCVLVGMAIVRYRQPISDRVELQFWVVGSEAESLERLLADFRQENPDISIRLQQMPWSAAHEKLLTAFAGNSTPDICQLGNTWIPEFAALGALREVSSFQIADPLPQEDFFTGIWETNEIAGRLYGIPWYVDTRVLFYRHDLLQAAGFESAPQTWPEWSDAMLRIQARLAPDEYAILLPSNEWEQIVILGLNSNEPMLRDDGQYGNFQNRSFRAAVDFYLGIYRNKLSPIVGTTEIANVWEEFNRGRFAMYITGPWNIGEFRKRLDPQEVAKWSTAPLPAPLQKGIGASLAGGCSLAIFNRCRHPTEAWKLVRYLSQAKTQVLFYQLTGNLPARKVAWETPALASDPWADAFRQQLGHVKPTPQVPEWEKIATRVFEHLDQAIRGRASPDQALDDLDQEVDRILSKRRWMMARGGLSP